MHATPVIHIKNDELSINLPLARVFIRALGAGRSGVKNTKSEVELERVAPTVTTRVDF